MYEIKFENVIFCRPSIANDPARCDIERLRIKPKMFALRERALSAHRANRAFHLGNVRDIPGCTPFPSDLGALRVSRGLARLSTNYYIVYLGFETVPGSFDEGMITLSPGGG